MIRYKRFVVIFLLTIVCFNFFSIGSSSVYASTKQVIISGGGLLTERFGVKEETYRLNKCIKDQENYNQTMEQIKKQLKEYTIEGQGGFLEYAKNTIINTGGVGFVVDAINGMVGFFTSALINSLMSMDCLIGIGPKTVFNILAYPIILKDVSGYKIAENIAQVFACVLLTFMTLVLVYEKFLASTREDISEAVADFSKKLLLAFFVIFFGTSFIQSILDIANVLLYSLLHISFPVKFLDGVEFKSTIPDLISYFGGFMSIIIETTGAEQSTSNFIYSIFFMIFGAMAMIYFIKYAINFLKRIFTIFVYSILLILTAPLLISETTSNIPKMIFKKIIGSAFYPIALPIVFFLAFNVAFSIPQIVNGFLVQLLALLVILSFGNQILLILEGMFEAVTFKDNVAFTEFYPKVRNFYKKEMAKRRSSNYINRYGKTVNTIRNK